MFFEANSAAQRAQKNIFLYHQITRLKVCTVQGPNPDSQGDS